MSTQLIHEMVLAAAERFPYRPAFWMRTSSGFKPLSYRDLAAQIIDVAGGLAELGVNPESRVGIYAGNSPQWCIAYLAVLACGGVVVPLDAQLKFLELKTLIGRARLAALFCPDSQREKLAELATLTPPHPAVIALDLSSGSGITLHKLARVGEGRATAPPEVDPDGMAVLMFTSGTSGESKGVMLSHRNITSDIRASRAHLPIDANDRLLSVLPLHHVFEATCGFLYPLSVGASIGHVKSLKSADIAEGLRSLDATMMCAVPLLYEKFYLRLKRRMAESSRAKRFYVAVGRGSERVVRKLTGKSVGKAIFRPLRKQAGLASLRMLVSGGAAADPAISEFFGTLGIDLLQGYGLTETSPVLSANTAGDNRYNSVGRALPGVELKILDKADSGVGEIAARGEMVMLGYYENETATGEVMEDGFFRTGDLGYLDRDGFLHITGRKKNLIVTPAGKNIYPEEIEAEIDKSPYVLESVVLPRRKGTGEEPIAVVVPDFEIINESAEEMPAGGIEDLVAREVMTAVARLAEFKRVKKVIVVEEELPKTSSKKIKRHEVVENLKKAGEL